MTITINNALARRLRLLWMFLCYFWEIAMRRLQSVTVCALLVISSAVAAFTALYAQEGKLNVFMRSKLVHAEKTLEGLATEDFALIEKHSQAISLLCNDELWSVMKTKEYQDRSDEFRRSVDAITNAAREKDLDAATLAYVDTTMKCVSCHKYVRKQK